MDQKTYERYTNILYEELMPALGCTEPISIAYAAAEAARLLGREPEHLVARCSGNIIKNVKAVVVPNSGGMKGIEAAALLGAVGGNPDKRLEVLTDVTNEHIAKTEALLAQKACTVALLQGGANLHIILEAFAEENSALVEIQDAHDHIIRKERNGEVLFTSDAEGPVAAAETDRDCLNIRDIITYADTVRMEDVADLMRREVDYNTCIAKEGLEKSYGANIGKTLLQVYGDDVKVRAKAAAAAGSDARMSGCNLPVMINSGSGNQGMTVSLPVIEYARELHKDDETLYRALVLSNLVAIHQKTGIGRLSAYCGAVSAACGSGAAITYLYGGDYEAISKTIVNTLANVSGIVCDGAKPSCAAKIASAVDAAILAHSMTVNDMAFAPGEGIVKDTVEETIQSVGRLARDGMRATDDEILKIMVDEED